MPKAIGICPPNLPQMIDHLIPLCDLMGIKVICFDAECAQLIHSEYPKIETVVAHDQWEEQLEECDTLFYTSLYRHGPFGFCFDKILYEKNIRSVCSLHGHSDKKQKQFWLERMVDEDVVLLYGKSLIETLKKKGIYSRLKNPLIMGNLRAHYFEKYREELEAKVPRWLKGKKNILYAPTWQACYPELQDQEESSSFFVAAEKLFHALPSDFQLVVKLHPLLNQFFPDEIAILKQKYQEKPNLFFLEHFPLIYPLLNHIDAYIGDHSSIGYDFLYFKRPMFFINHNCRENPLFKGGEVVDVQKCDTIYAKLDKHIPNPHQETLYKEAFEPEICYETLKHQIEEALCKKSPY